MSETKLPPRTAGADAAGPRPSPAASRPIPLERAGAAAAGAGAAGPAICPLARTSMFMRPEWLAASDWLDHTPFAFWLVEVLRPRVLVELGTGDGVSYLAFCQAVARLGLDTRCYGVARATVGGSGSRDNPGAEALDAIEVHNRVRYAGFSRLLRLGPDEALAHFSDATIDLLHIDGRQPLEAARRELDAWWPRLSERAVVLLHGSDLREGDSGVPRLAEELGATHPCFEFPHGSGLAVLGVGSKRPEPLERLFAAGDSEGDRAAARAMFARLGRAVADARGLAALEDEAGALAAKLDSERDRCEALDKALEAAREDAGRQAREAAEARAKLEAGVEQQAVERGQLTERVALLEELRTEWKDQRARLEARADEDRAVLRDHAEARRKLEAEAEEHARLLGEARAEAARKDEALAAANAELARRKHALGEAEAGLEDERAAAAAAREDVEAARAALAGCEEALRTAEADLETERQAAAALRAETEAQRDALWSANAEIEAERSVATAVRFEAEAARDALAGCEAALYGARAELVAERDAAAAARAEVRDLRGEQERLEAALDAAAVEAEAEGLAASQAREQARSLTAARQAAERARDEEKAARRAAEAALEKDTAALAENDRKHGRERDRLHKAAEALQTKLDARTDEVARLTGLLRDADARREELERELADAREARVAAGTLFGRAVVALGGLPQGRRPRRGLIRRLAARLRNAGLLDGAWYLERNRDVAEAGIDPAEHFLCYGALEGREPCDIRRFASAGRTQAGA